VAMRPPIGSITLSRRAKVGLWVVGILIVLIIALVQFTGVYINWLWYKSVGYHGVYSTIFWTRVVLFFSFGLVMALIIGGNVFLAYRLRPPFRPMSVEQQNIERYRVILEPRRVLILVAVSVIALLSAGLSAQGNWQIWQLFLNGQSFGMKDPQFHLDISFYAWDYPAYRSMLGFGFAAIIFAIVLSIVVHYLCGAIRIQTPGPKFTLAARRHLTILVFVFVLLKAMAYWLDRYGFVLDKRTSFTGASYTDVHAALPARTILFWIALIIAAALLASLWLRSTLLPGIAFVSMLVISILISGIYPAILQSVSVKPNASSKEAPYIEKNITATREAYGIVTGSDVDYETYNTVASPSTTSVTTANPTVADIRLLDPNVLSPTFTQQQQIRNVYGFPGKLDVDRYQSSDGTVRDYIVGVRELDANNLKGDQSNWINQHTVYTHGYGFVAAAANTDVTNDASLYTESDIPPTGPLGLKNPEAYFGELLPSYSIVGAKGVKQEYNASAGPKISYTGGGGVSLGSLFTRLAFAVNYKETNFVLNSSASAPGAKIIFNRDPRARVKKVAPYLTVDGDPYPVVDSKTGDIVWIVDGYTTMNNFPYSQRNSLSSLTKDSLSDTGKTASQPNDQINYIRNSVKATVDAYTGKVTLYDWDPTDPVLNTWKKIFPGTVKPKADMPQELQDHVRYPEDLFEIQRSLLGSYHVDNPVTFYNVGDKWTVPTDPNDASSNQPPYYVLASKPGSGATTPQFQLTSPMIVNSKQNLAAYVSVDSDPGPNYGKFTVLKVSTASVTKGPEQVSNILSTNATISKDLSLFNGGGSSVVRGNLLTLPLGNSFLYVEPLYVQASAANGSYPTLQRVLVSYGDKVGYAATLAGALSNLDDPVVGSSLPGASTGGSTPTPTPTPTGTSSSPTTTPSTSTTPVSGAGVTLTQLNGAYTQLQDAYKTGNQATISSAEANVLTLLSQYLKDNPGAALPSGSATAGTTPTPTTTPTR
jgi:uncharacterized membrane protein (UPF0182 family)